MMIASAVSCRSACSFLVTPLSATMAAVPVTATCRPSCARLAAAPAACRIA